MLAVRRALSRAVKIAAMKERRLNRRGAEYAEDRGESHQKIRALGASALNAFGTAKTVLTAISTCFSNQKCLKRRINTAVWHVGDALNRYLPQAM
jgi:hypothetical protein